MRSWLVTPLLFAMAITACGDKKPSNSGPIVGWHTEEGWSTSCYFPPAWDDLGPGDRKLARTKALNEMMNHWTGKRGDGVNFDSEIVTSFETVLLGQPDFIESVAEENVAFCRRYATGMEGTERWSAWVKTRPGELTEGQCRYAPLDYTLWNYLDIQSEWQIPANVCAGDKVQISATPQDYYRLDPKGGWINSEGDRDQPTTDPAYPCNWEGCYAGQVIMRFTGDSGVQSVHPVGLGLTWSAPEHGKIEVQINDTSWFDNQFKVAGGLEHHTGIEYKGVGQ
jgi:hypothetical protein